MKFIKKLFIVLLVLINMPIASFGMEEAIKATKQKWKEEKSKFKEADRAKLAQELQEQIRLDKIRESSQHKEERLKLDEDIKINTDKLNYIKSLDFEFEIRSEMAKVPEGGDTKVYQDAIERQEAIQKELDIGIEAKLTQQIVSTFNQIDGGSNISNKLTQIIETIQENILQPIKNAIDKFFGNNRGEFSPEAAKGTAIKFLKQAEKGFSGNKAYEEGTVPPPKIVLSLKSLNDQLTVFEHAGDPKNKSGNINFDQTYRDYTSRFINRAVNDDIDYTIQHQKDPKTVQEYHEVTADKLGAIGVDEAQIKKLSADRDNAVKKITAEFNTPEAKKQITDFLNLQNTEGKFNISSYKKLADETEGLNPTKTADHATMMDNVEQLKTTVDALNDFAKYSLDSLDLKTQTQLLEFLDAEQAFLANSYEDILASPLTTDKSQIDTLRSNLTKIENDLTASQNRLVDNAEKNRIKNEKRLEVQKIIKDENSKGIKPLEDAFITLANKGVPTAGGELIELLVKEKPLSPNLNAKFQGISRGIEEFVKKSAESDPSKKSVEASEIILTEINDLRDAIKLYNDTTELTAAEQKQLVQYYEALDKLYTKVATQGIKDMNNLLRRLNDRTIIYLDQAKRAQPTEEFLKAFARQSSPDFIDAWFKAGRLDMTTSEGISGGSL